MTILKCNTIKEHTIHIRHLLWDDINTHHIVKKGIKPGDIEDAIFLGEIDIRKGRKVRRRVKVIQRNYALAKAPHGESYKIVLEPLDKREGIWRCITAWKTK
jgi:hypothetical protein